MLIGPAISICSPGSAGWSPLQITGVQRFLTAYAGVATSGANVTGWTDQTAAATVYSSAGAFRPQYDANGFGSGKPGITFTKGTHYLEGASYTPSTGFSVFAVAKTTDNTAPPATYVNAQPNPLVSDATGAWNWSLGLVQNTVELSRYDGSTVNHYTSAAVSANDGNPYLFGATHASGGSVNVYKNTSVVASGTKTYLTPTITAIGTDFAYNDKFGGTIGAVVIVSGVISAGDLNKLYAWAQTYFGVA